MGIFNLLETKSFQNDREAISALIEIAAFSVGDESVHEKPNMDRVLKVAEEYARETQNPMLAYWLGIAWRNYTSWHIRGNARKTYLEKAATYFEKAFSLGRENLPVQLPPEKRHDINHLDQISIAGELGRLFVNEAIIRDLDKAEVFLKFVAENTWEYKPCLYAYVELYYKRGDYKRSAEIALDVHRRIKKSPEWKGVPGFAGTLGLAGKAYRALGKKAKKQGKTDEAINWFQKIVDLGIATDNDKRILSKLEQG